MWPVLKLSVLKLSVLKLTVLFICEAQGLHSPARSWSLYLTRSACKPPLAARIERMLREGAGRGLARGYFIKGGAARDVEMGAGLPSACFFTTFRAQVANCIAAASSTEAR